MKRKSLPAPPSGREWATPYVQTARIFELLKPLNITRVFVYRTAKLFLDTGGVGYIGYRLQVLMGWSLLPDALRPFKIYCASPSITSQLVLFFVANHQNRSTGTCESC